MHSALRVPARMSFVKDLPHEQACTGAGGGSPPSLDSKDCDVEIVVQPPLYVTRVERFGSKCSFIISQPSGR